MSVPRLTIVVASRTGLPESRPLLEHLRTQTLAGDLEVIVVAPRGAIDPAELAALDGFESIRLLEVERVTSRGEAAAIGLLQARAPFAGPCENHAFPDPDTLARLIADRDAEDAAVSATMRSANPESSWSLAMYLATYWHAAAPADPAPRDSLPHHNGIWRTDFLRELGDRLPELMGDESRLHAEARRRGLRLRVRPDAVTWHVNEARPGRGLSDPFILGMRYGAARSASLGWARRLLYAAAFPALALLHWRTLLVRAARTDDTRARAASLAPTLALTAGASALGEAWGGLFPRTPIPAHLEEHEFHLRGRLAGIAPTAPWLREVVSRLPDDLA